MGDPLSVAASVAGLVSLGLQATEYLYKYYSELRDRGKNLAQISDRLHELLQPLRTIDHVIRTRVWRLDEKTILQNTEASISRCEDVVCELQDEVKKFRAEPTDTLTRTIKLREDVDDLLGNLSTALQALQLKEHQTTHEELREIKQIILLMQAHSLTTDVQNWLKAADATIDYHAACAKRHPGTGQWLVQSSAFVSWLEHDNSFQWLCGFAGCGKSALCSTAIQHAFALRGQRVAVDSALAFFYFTFRDESKQSASALLRALLLQLSAQIPGVETDVARLRNQYKHGTPSVSVLMELLRSAVARSPCVYILLDALDECPAGGTQKEVVNLIQNMRQWSLPSLHLLVTSRDIPAIRQNLRLEAENVIALNPDSVQQDTSSYVSECLANDPSLQRWGDLRGIIQNYLVKHANGIFRWAECQLEPLRTCPESEFDLENCLHSLPSTLDKTYQRMLCGIDEHCRERAHRILSLLCLSPEPLSVDEVLEALAVDVDDKLRCDSRRRLKRSSDLLRICPGLVDLQCRRSRHADDNEDDNPHMDDGLEGNLVVRIAHFSVQEYLMSSRINQGPAAYFAVSTKVGSAQISKTCLIYLCNPDFIGHPLSLTLTQRYSLAPLAAQHWHVFYKLSRGTCTSDLDFWVETLLTDQDARRRWLTIHRPDTPWDTRVDYQGCRSCYALPLYYAAFVGLETVFPRVLSRSLADINGTGGIYGTPLQAASDQGYVQIVQSLITAEADVSIHEKNTSIALTIASAQGHAQIVWIPITAGADVNQQSQYCGSPLSGASDAGRTNIIQILLSAGADVNHPGTCYGTALCAASARGHVQAVLTLLAAGANMDAQSGPYGTALVVASNKGYTEIVKILLAAGADVNVHVADSLTALSAAAARGYVQIVLMLFAAGADRHARSERHGTALCMASARGQTEVVLVLLAAGMDVNAQDGMLRTALFNASARGHVESVRALLAAGARVDNRCGKAGNALGVASTKGHAQIAQMLLEAQKEQGYTEEREPVAIDAEELVEDAVKTVHSAQRL